MDAVHTHFLWIDWAVLIGYLLLTTYIGHALRGKQATMRDFFLGGRSLPWPAVCGSIIATEISALTFVGVPAMVFAAKGNFTYLQWALGSVVARFIVGRFFVPAFYEREIYSPYQFMGERLGNGVKTATTVLFFLGAILGQSVRLLVTAIILRTVTGMPFVVCIVIIGIFAVGWTLMGGMTTVIWTDVIQFGLFVFGGSLALIWLVTSLNNGWSDLISVNEAAGKLKFLDLTTDPAVGFTLWVAILAMPFQNMAAFGTDQLNAQRMFCCRSQADASKAIYWSSVSQVITIMMLFVGAGLVAFYQQRPPSAAEAALFSSDADYVFPVWITTVLPPGVTGLILAGAFAAAISSLDSVLAALSQTTLGLFSHRFGEGDEDHKRVLWWSKVAVICWGVGLAAFAVALDHMRGDINVVNLAFGMVSYTYGPMLGIFLLALLPFHRDGRGVWIGVVLSILLVLYVRPDLYTILTNLKVITLDQAKAWQPKLHYAWMYPITTLVTLGCGLMFGRRTSE
jgi:SSS family transporter